MQAPPSMCPGVTAWVLLYAALAGVQSLSIHSLELLDIGQVPKTVASAAGLMVDSKLRKAQRHAQHAGRWLDVGDGTHMYVGDLPRLEALADMADAMEAIDEVAAATRAASTSRARRLTRSMNNGGVAVSVPELNTYVEVEAEIGGHIIWAPSKVVLSDADDGTFTVIVNGDPEFIQHFDIHDTHEWRPCYGQCAQAALAEAFACTAREWCHNDYGRSSEEGFSSADEQEDETLADWEDCDVKEATACDFDALFSDLGLNYRSCHGDPSVEQCLSAMRNFEKVFFTSDNPTCNYDRLHAERVFKTWGTLYQRRRARSLSASNAQ